MSAIDQLLERGLIGPLDHRLAAALARLADVDDERVGLGVALASRALAHGDVGVDLRRVQTTLSRSLEPDAPALPAFPEPEAWAGSLAGVPLLVRRPEERRSAPLVLDRTDLYLERTWMYQDRLAGHVRRRLSAPPHDVDRVRMRELLARLALDDPRALLQRRAAVTATLRGFALVAGGPGTGKTAVVVKLVALLQALERARDRRPLRVRLAAPTGKAAARMSESLRLGALRWVPEDLAAGVQAEASTIHRLLGWRGRTRFVHDAANPLAVDLLIVDEASMIDLPLMTRLVDAVPATARLVLLGDPDQLGSVDIGRVFADLCEACAGPVSSVLHDAWRAAGALGGTADDVAVGGPEPLPGDASTTLRHTWRYRAGSGIEALAQAVNAGDATASLAVLTDPAFPDVELREPGSSESTTSAIERLVLEPYASVAAATSPAAALERLSAIRVLGAVRQGPLGVEAINASLDRAVRARLGVSSEADWYAGRPVMVVRNDDDARLYNGDVGVVLGEGSVPGAVKVWFPAAIPGKERAVSASLLPEHETVFATTVHKSQGSEYAHVVLVLPGASSPLLTRELLYTAVTRASERVTVFARPTVWAEAVRARGERMSRLASQIVDAPGADPTRPMARSTA